MMMIGLSMLVIVVATALTQDGANPALATQTPNGDGKLIWRFDDTAPGRLPEGWKSEATNPAGEANPWSVQTDASAVSGDKVLALSQTPHFQRGTFNLCWTDEVQFRDGAITVKVRSGTGEVDQGGGPIWRVQDADNYYIARWNPLEDNLRVYYVKDGKRKQLASAEFKADPTKWHTIRIEHTGDQITCSFDDTKHLNVTDTTFSEAGGVGVWTKADAASSFDDFGVNIEAPRR